MIITCGMEPAHSRAQRSSADTHTRAAFGGGFAVSTWREVCSQRPRTRAGGAAAARGSAVTAVWPGQTASGPGASGLQAGVFLPSFKGCSTQGRACGLGGQKASFMSGVQGT